MKLSKYAKQLGVSYLTAYSYWKNGKLQGYQTHTGTIIITENKIPTDCKIAVIRNY